MGTTLDSHSVASVLFGRARTAVLTVLMRNPDTEVYVREMVRSASVGQGAVQRELANLVRMGIAIRTRRGNQVFYRANRESPVFDELRSLVNKTAGVADVLRAAVASLSGKVRLAFVFGSIAKGMDSPTSDVDIMLVGEVTLAQVVQAFQEAQDTLSREINPSVFAPADFSRRIASKDHFISSVLREPMIYLLGGEDELRRLAGEGLADPSQDKPTGSS